MQGGKRPPNKRRSKARHHGARRSAAFFQPAMPRKLEWSLCIAAAVILASVCIGHLQHRYAPAFSAATSDRVTSFVSAAVDERVKAEVTDGLRYEDLIQKERDPQGNPRSLTTDVARINQIERQAAALAAEVVEAMEPQELSISVGTLSGVGILSERGPRLPIAASLRGQVRATVTQDFSAQGEKKTRHRLLLTLDIPLRGVMGFQVWEGTVRTEILLGEAVLVDTAPAAS